jgi:hypothetical protein
VSFGSTLVAIVAIIAVVWLRNQKLRREGHGPLPPQNLMERDGYTRELEREVVDLRKRIEVLERIATDDTRRLSHEIERLRDQ